MKKRIAALLICCLLWFTQGLALAETKTVYFKDLGSTLHAYDIDPEDYFPLFDSESDRYIHRIGQLSILTAITAFRDDAVPLDESHHNVETFLAQMGFEGFRAYDYNRETTADTISNAIAYKRMTAKDGTPYVLLAVPVCGQGYGNEWLSNMEMDNGEDHAGFLVSAREVYDRVVEYVDSVLPGERVKVWATGFSRAAAVSNNLGNLLLQDSRFAQNDIFVYTFGTPNTTLDPVAWPQIYNICGSFDPVPHVPLADWGYGKHGTTLFLPSLDSDEDYADLLPAYYEQFSQIKGMDTVYEPRSDRNWLISHILNLLYTFLPEAELYTATIQDALQTAWATEGGVFDKLGALIDVAEANGAGERDDLDVITRELKTLITIVAADTLQSADAIGGSSTWLELLTSGMDLAEEHFPAVYFAWMMSDDGSRLFGADNYIRTMVYGDVDIVINRWKDAADLREVLLDTANGIRRVSFVNIRNTDYIGMPATDGRMYSITITARTDTPVQAGIGLVDLRKVHSEMNTTEDIELKAGESVEIWVIRLENSEELIATAITDENELFPFLKNTDGLSSLLNRNSAETSYETAMMVISMVFSVLYLVCSAMVVIYAMVVAVKRLVRGRIENHAEHRKSGAVIMYITAAASMVLAVMYGIGLLARMADFKNVTVTNATMQLISRFMGLRTGLFLGCGLVLHLLLALECFMSISWQLPRIRVVRLSILMLILDGFSVLAAQDLHTLTRVEAIQFLVPVLSLIGLRYLRVQGDGTENVGKTWIPVTRAVVCVIVLFLIREALLVTEVLDTRSLISVLLKTLNCLPILLLALVCLKRVNNVLHLTTFWALLCYTVANSVINFSLVAGTVFYIIGHVILLSGYIRIRKPDKLQWLVLAVLVAGFTAELIWLRGSFSTGSLISSMIYNALLCSILVTAFPISPRLRTGTFLFALSNELLLLNMSFTYIRALDTMELALFYAALLVLVSSPEAMRTFRVRKRKKKRS